MTRIGTLRETFDRDMDFITNKPFKFDGKMFIPGQSFDKTLVTTRRLRQLYESRFLRMGAPEVRAVREDRAPVVVDLGNLVPDEKPAKPPRVKRVKLQASA